MSYFSDIINQGSSIRYFDCNTGNFGGEERLPKDFSYKSDWSQCKNCQISPKEILIGDSKGNLFIKNLFSQKEFLFERNPDDFILCTDSILDRLLITGSGDGDISICNFLNSDSIKFEKFHKNWVYCVMLLKENLFSSCSRDNTVKIFDFIKLKEIITFSDHTDDVSDLSFNEEKNLLFSCSRDKTLNIYNVKQNAINRIEKLFDSSLESVLNFDENYFLSGDYNGNLYCFDLRNLKNLIYMKKIHRYSIGRILKNNNNSIITGSFDKYIKIIKFSNGKELMKIKDREKSEGIFLFENGKYRRREVILDFKGVETKELKEILSKKDEMVVPENGIFDNFYFSSNSSYDALLRLCSKSEELYRKVRKLCGGERKLLLSMLERNSSLKKEVQKKEKIIENLNGNDSTKKRNLPDKLQALTTKESLEEYKIKLDERKQVMDSIINSIDKIETRFCEKKLKKVFDYHNNHLKFVVKEIKEIKHESRDEFSRNRFLEFKSKYEDIRNEIKKEESSVSVNRIVRLFSKKINNLRNRIKTSEFLNFEEEKKLRVSIDKMSKDFEKRYRKFVDMMLSKMENRYVQFTRLVNNTLTIERLKSSNMSLKEKRRNLTKDMLKRKLSFDECELDNLWESKDQMEKEKTLIKELSQEIEQFRFSIDEHSKIIQRNHKKGHIMEYLIKKLSTKSITYVKDQFSELRTLLEKKGMCVDRKFKKDYEIVGVLEPLTLYKCRFKGERNDSLTVIKVIEFNESNQLSIQNNTLKMLKLKEHPSIVKIKNVFFKTEEKLGKIYLETDYYENDLLSWLKGTKRIKVNTVEECRKLLSLPNRVSKDEIIRVFKSILEGISYVHRNEIQFRDFTPLNILINNVNDVKIVGVGMVKVVKASSMLFQNQGIERYFSPERRSSKVGDMWAFGKMLFEALVDPKFVELDFDSAKQHFKDQIEIDVLSKLLANNPNERMNVEEALKHEFFNNSVIFNEKFDILRREKILTVQKLLKEECTKHQKITTNNQDLEFNLDRKNVLQGFENIFDGMNNLRELCQFTKVKFIGDENGNVGELNHECFSLFIEEIGKCRRNENEFNVDECEEEGEIDEEEEKVEKVKRGIMLFFDRVNILLLPTDQVDKKKEFYNFGKIFCRSLFENRHLRIRLCPLVWYYVLMGRLPSKFEELVYFCKLYDEIFVKRQLSMLKLKDFSSLDLDYVLFEEEENMQSLKKENVREFVKYQLKMKLAGCKFRVGNLNGFRSGFLSCLKNEPIRRVITSNFNFNELCCLFYGQNECSTEALFRNIEFINSKRDPKIEEYLTKWIREDSTVTKRFQFIRFAAGINGLGWNGNLIKNGEIQRIKVNVIPLIDKKKVVSRKSFFELDFVNESFKDYGELRVCLEDVLENLEVID